MGAQAHIGTSGWSYDHWTGVLYPPGTPARRRLEIYIRVIGVPSPLAARRRGIAPVWGRRAG
ncbi:hypothetical protein Franean1_6787 [Parafrankia sp. EAN1pec]|nr:hypothetical protein Franean1_6787 [Frankia sp. EAN1pec]